jgi:hypothetical protein
MNHDEEGLLDVALDAVEDAKRAKEMAEWRPESVRRYAVRAFRGLQRVLLLSAEQPKYRPFYSVAEQALNELNQIMREERRHQHEKGDA